MTKGKYQYWHRILEINPNRDDLKAQAKVGKLVAFGEKREGVVESFSFTTGKSDWLFRVEYVGRIESSMSIPEKIAWLEQHELRENSKEE